MDKVISVHPDLGLPVAAGKKNTKARVNNEILLAHFVETRGTVKSNEKKDAMPIWDQELFCTNVERARPSWSKEKIKDEWRVLEQTTPACDKEYGGPREAPLQLPIPSWIGDCFFGSIPSSVSTFLLLFPMAVRAES